MRSQEQINTGSKKQFWLGMASIVIMALLFLYMATVFT